jgi:DNA polymerase (family 10)
MKNQEIAAIFEQMADLLDLLGENPFRGNSYRRAARALQELQDDVGNIAAAGKLEEVDGIGKGTAEKIQQYLASGKIAQYEELLAQIPPGVPKMLAIPHLGPKTLAKLWKDAGITSTEDLKAALEKSPERITAIAGMGDKKVQQLRESLAFMDKSGGRILLGEADEMAQRLVSAVSASEGAGRVMAAGSLRRGRETVGDIDLLCEAPASAAAGIIESFAAASDVARVDAKGSTKGSVILSAGVQADLRVVEKKSFGAALAYFTGSKEHNVRLRELAVKMGLKLNEYGLFKGEKPVAGEDEAGIYAALGLAYVPPELREDRGEVEAAGENAMPKLLELDDIRGDLHMHTIASDGANTIEEMIRACRDLGYRYMAISDHSRGQVQANGLDEKRLAKHVAEIRRVAKQFKDITVLCSIEVDIHKDGSLDFEYDVLAELDFVTASAHSALSMGREEATARLIRAIEHPRVHCIGHPSGRLINQRPGMELDVGKIARAAAANNVALEINAHPSRLDLRDVHVREAIAHGAKVLINTDAHSIANLALMKYGVTTARRGWATAEDVLNAWPPAKLKKWIQAKN